MTNIIAFQPRRKEGCEPAEVPALMCVELRLDEACGLEMLLRSSDGDVVATLQYTLTARSPEGWDLEALRTSWDHWRGGSARAS